MRECPKYALISPVCLVHLVALQIKHLFFSPQLSLTPCDPMDCSTPGFLSFPISQNFLKLMSMGLVMPTNHLVPFPPTFSLSQHQSFLSQLFSLRGQSDGASASASVLPMNIQDWSPLGWTGWISLQSKGLSRVFFNTTVKKHQFFNV